MKKIFLGISRYWRITTNNLNKRRFEKSYNKPELKNTRMTLLTNEQMY